jgi:acetyl esterase/lipase
MLANATATPAAFASAEYCRRVALRASAGGALTLAMVLRAKQFGLPIPGAIAPGTPMSDVTKVGDTFYTNELVDNSFSFRATDSAMQQRSTLARTT